MIYNITIISILEVLSVVVPVLLTVAFVTVAERKTMASMQRRLGPNIIGFYGLLQAFADALKLLIKEYVSPAQANLVLFFLGPVITLIFSLLGYAVIPYGPGLMIWDFNLGILYMLAVSSLATYGILLAGWSANSKYAFLGSLRSTAQLISYELILSSAILLVVLLTGSLSLTVTTEFQRIIIFAIPLLPIFMIFFMGAVAETNRAPFDLAEAESELVSGFMTEHAAVIFVFFFLAEYASIVLICILTTILFIGGYLFHYDIIKFIYDLADYYLYLNLNIYQYISNTYHLVEGLIHGLSLGTKSSILIFTFIWVRASFPRIRFDQLMSYSWTMLLPLLIGIITTAPCVILAFDNIPNNSLVLASMLIITKLDGLIRGKRNFSGTCSLNTNNDDNQHNNTDNSQSMQQSPQQDNQENTQPNNDEATQDSNREASQSSNSPSSIGGDTPLPYTVNDEETQNLIDRADRYNIHLNVNQDNPRYLDNNQEQIDDNRRLDEDELLERYNENVVSTSATREEYLNTNQNLSSNSVEALRDVFKNNHNDLNGYWTSQNDRLLNTAHRLIGELWNEHNSGEIDEATRSRQSLEVADVQEARWDQLLRVVLDAHDAITEDQQASNNQNTSTNNESSSSDAGSDTSNSNQNSEPENNSVDPSSTNVQDNSNATNIDPSDVEQSNSSNVSDKTDTNKRALEPDSDNIASSSNSNKRSKQDSSDVTDPTESSDNPDTSGNPGNPDNPFPTASVLENNENCPLYYIIDLNYYNVSLNITMIFINIIIGLIYLYNNNLLRPYQLLVVKYILSKKINHLIIYFKKISR